MYKNPHLTPQERAADLLAKMTVEEKLDQMIFSSRLTRSVKRSTRGKNYRLVAGLLATLVCWRVPMRHSISVSIS